MTRRVQLLRRAMHMACRTCGGPFRLGHSTRACAWRREQVEWLRLGIDLRTDGAAMPIDQASAQLLVRDFLDAWKPRPAVASDMADWVEQQAEPAMWFPASCAPPRPMVPALLDCHMPMLGDLSAFYSDEDVQLLIRARLAKARAINAGAPCFRACCARTAERSAGRWFDDANTRRAA